MDNGLRTLAVRGVSDVGYCRHWIVVKVPPEGDLEFQWDSEMCRCFIHVTIKLVSGTTQRSVIESCITHVSSSPQETVPRGNRSHWGSWEGSVMAGEPVPRGVSPRAPWSMTLASGDDPHNSGPIQWARGKRRGVSEICFLVNLDRRKEMRRVCLLDFRCVFLSFSSPTSLPYPSVAQKDRKFSADT